MDALTDNIRILSGFEIAKIQQKYNTNCPIFGTYDTEEIGIGNGCKTPKITEQTLSHESIHEILTELFKGYLKDISMSFDRDLFYNFEQCKNGEVCKSTIIRDTLISFFTIEEDTPLI